MKLKLGEPPTKGTGFVNGHAYWGKVTLETGTRIWTDHKVLIEDMKNISDTIGQKIDGILGADILNEFQCVEIDFEHKLLVLSSK